MKDLESGRLSWIILTGPECNHRCLCKREAEGALMSAERKERKVTCGWKQRRGFDYNKKKRPRVARRVKWNQGLHCRLPRWRKGPRAKGYRNAAVDTEKARKRILS